MIFRFLILMLWLNQTTYAQFPCDTLSVSDLLENMHKRDQMTRKRQDSVSFVRFIDSTNQQRLATIVNSCGWPSQLQYGYRANVAAFLVLQHADSSFQLAYYPAFKQSVDQGNSRKSDLALLEDRILMRRGKKQVYGSQVVFNKDGKAVFYPIDDPLHVNDRRKSMGLEPIEDYARKFTIDWPEAN